MALKLLRSTQTSPGKIVLTPRDSEEIVGTILRVQGRYYCTVDGRKFDCANWVQVRLCLRALGYST